ncbi:ABC transporter permease [Actinocrinis puniceicyclus]|uniref:ABC transporter permease n=1 Tax=Actinocrinis puniceicyclus TaxID=977794 RepID=A0A8J7WID5_9ACTN|nr:ABC transporter permease [Actinocrinis puniceicyclus]MBS2961863.1 ABC transporter permease [Actinocrinis puniceicyclus]
MTSSTLARPSTGTGHANFGRLMTAEWTKLRTVRSTVWSFAILIVAVLGFTALFTFLTVQQWSQMGADARAQAELDPVPQILGSGLFLGQLAICVLGVLVATSEYSTGMIRSTLLAAPHRLRMLCAKCVVFTIPVLIVGEVLSFTSYGIGKSILASKVRTSLGDPHVMRAVVGEGLYLAVLGLFALAIGQLIRHTAGAITTVIALVLVLVPLAGLLPGNIGKHVSAYLPTNAGQQIMQIYPKDQILSAWQGFGVFGLWTAVLLAVSAWLLVRRDA